MKGSAVGALYVVRQMDIRLYASRPRHYGDIFTSTITKLSQTKHYQHYKLLFQVLRCYLHGLPPDDNSMEASTKHVPTL